MIKITRLKNKTILDLILTFVLKLIFEKGKGLNLVQR